MRTTKWVVLAALAMAAFGSCTQPDQYDKVSISERITQFVNDLNGNEDNAWKNFHPDSASRNATKNYDITLGPQFPRAINDHFLPGGIPGGNPVVTTIHDSTNPVRSISFQMEEDREHEWFIRVLDIDGTIFN